MNIFQRKSSKRVKGTDGSQEKGGSRGKNDLLDRAKGGLDDPLAGGLRSAKNDAEAATEKLQADVQAGIETILHTGSGILEKAKADFGSRSEATRSKELEQGSEEQGTKNMEAFSAVLDKVKSNPKVVEKVEEVMNLAEAFHLTKHESKEPEADEKANDEETAQNIDESTSAGETEGLGAVVEHAVEEIRAAVAAVQQQQLAVGDETETEASTEVAAAEASAEGEKPEATTREVEKDDPTKRIDFFGFFTKLFERFCSPANKKD